SSFSSPLDSRELELLEMIFNDAEGYPSGDRGQRDISVLPASSIGCDESGSQEDYNMFDELEQSEECLDFLPPFEEPSFEDRLPFDHPCFVRMLLLRTPLLKQDPCANFSLASAAPTTTTKKPRNKKCNPKGRTTQNATKKELPSIASVNSTTSAPPTNTTTEADSRIITIRKLVPRKRKNKLNTTTTSTSTTTTMETTTQEETTTPAETTTETESPTTTELETTTLPPTTTTTTTAAPTTTTTTINTTTTTSNTTDPPLANYQLKHLKALRRMKNKTPNVPDPPQIKIDGTSQPSEVIQVIMTTEAAQLRVKPDEYSTTTVMPTTTTTTTSEPETTTEESCEDDEDEVGEVTKQPEFFENEEQEVECCDQWENKDSNTAEKPCEDTDEQDTNLCPQIMPAQRKAPSRPKPTPRYRKPVKNYVEPILYEGQFNKQRMLPIGPQPRDYFVSSKQIMPRPIAKYRKRIPPSIYMNNIIRGMDCSDEVTPSSGEYPRIPAPPQRYWDLRRIGSLQPNQRLRNIGREMENLKSFVAAPAKRFNFRTAEDFSNQERQYMMERDPEQHMSEENGLPEERVGSPAEPTSTLDPCQEEHDYLYRKILNRQQNDFPQQPNSLHFFT
ncbi:hypothetical protein KR009_001081, partial [Drosophila setifemur]